jgi:hypothetical protein
MTLREAAQELLEVREIGGYYAENQAYNRFCDALSAEHSGNERFVPPGKAEAARIAREIVGGE